MGSVLPVSNHSVEEHVTEEGAEAKGRRRGFPAQQQSQGTQGTQHPCQGSLTLYFDLWAEPSYLLSSKGTSFKN